MLQIKIETGELVEFTEPRLKFVEPDGSTIILTPEELVADKERAEKFLEGAVKARILEHTEAGTQTYYSRSLRVVEVGAPLKPEKKAKKEKETTAPADTSTSEKEEENDVQ